MGVKLSGKASSPFYCRFSSQCGSQRGGGGMGVSLVCMCVWGGGAGGGGEEGVTKHLYLP